MEPERVVVAHSRPLEAQRIAHPHLPASQRITIPRLPALRRLACLGLVVALASAACGQREEGGPVRVRRTRPEAPPEHRVELAGLRAYIGQLPDDVALWETDPLKSRMQALLQEKYPAFLGSLAEASPIEEENGRLVIKGKTQVQRRVDRGLVIIAPDEDLLYLWCEIGGQVLEFRERGKAFTLPPSALRWIASK